MMQIDKKPNNKNDYKSKLCFFNTAREGFGNVLKCLKEKHKDFTLLLPAYIGYSPNEGSGIYDPVIQNEINHKFYKLTGRLQIDIDDYERCIKSTQGKIVILLVHYFGYVDKNIDKVIELAKQNNCYIIEDCAHAFYTDYVDNMCGKNGKISIYSLHKMFPFATGGMIKSKDNFDIENNINIKDNPFEYDLWEIANMRKTNARIVEQNVKDIKGIEILRENKDYANQTPQTYPILIKSEFRDDFYHRLNDKGFGVVSLYHTMIDVLKKDEYKEANYLSKHILNLPLHQDARKEQLINMCNEIRKLCEEFNEKV